MFSILRLVLIFLLIATAASSGCKREPQQKPASPPLAIGVSVVTDGFEELLEPFKKEMQSLAKERKVRLIWKEAKKAEDQVKDFEGLLKQKPGAVLAFMPESKEAQKISQMAKEKDVRLMAVGILPPETPLDGFVGINAGRIGEQQGDYLMEALKERPKGRVLILTTDSDNPAEQELLKGNRRALGQELQVTVRTMPDTNISLGLNEIWEELGVLDGLITHEVKATKAALISLAGQPFKPISIGIGAGKDIVQFIAGGVHEAEIDVEPEVMARYALEAAYQLAKTGEWDFDTWVDNGSYQIPVKYGPSRVITKENLTLLQPRHGAIEPKSPDGQSVSPKAEEEGKQKEEGQKQKNEESKIKVKLKDGKELEFRVPGEIEGIQLEGKAGEGKKEGGKGQGEQEGKGGDGGK